ncbi:MAG: ABC transporter ATP-binding protein [Proteobacteria bacterium]|nr:ABC transporter ATP-binding protein [Pseudomonadota bacterium]
MSVLLEVQGITAHYAQPEAPVLAGVSFALAPGEIVALIGVSGCGKTTLLDILAGFRRADEGEVRLAGQPTVTPEPDKAVVFQEDALFPWLTAQQNVAFGLKAAGVPRRERRAQATAMLQRVGLAGSLDRLPRELSGGMRQRVALARVLVMRPRLLLMDEPFAALDALTREEMHDLLLELHAEFTPAILMVTHDVAEAAKLADRILLLKHGQGLLAGFDIPLPRPRDLHSPELATIQAACRNLLAHGPARA